MPEGMPNPMLGYPAWQQWAREEGYPECEVCGEPLPKHDWKRGRHKVCRTPEGIDRNFYAGTGGTDAVSAYEGLPTKRRR
jgi:hypothetical protein